MWWASSGCTPRRSSVRSGTAEALAGTVVALLAVGLPLLLTAASRWRPGSRRSRSWSPGGAHRRRAPAPGGRVGFLRAGRRPPGAARGDGAAAVAGALRADAVRRRQRRAAGARRSGWPPSACTRRPRPATRASRDCRGRRPSGCATSSARSAGRGWPACERSPPRPHRRRRHRSTSAAGTGCTRCRPWCGPAGRSCRCSLVLFVPLLPGPRPAERLVAPGGGRAHRPRRRRLLAGHPLAGRGRFAARRVGPAAPRLPAPARWLGCRRSTSSGPGWPGCSAWPRCGCAPPAGRPATPAGSPTCAWPRPSGCGPSCWPSRTACTADAPPPPEWPLYAAARRPARRSR